MFFDIGWPELMLIGAIALVVIGPKDLPRALRVAGYWVRRARTMSREFQGSIEQMIRDAELHEVRDELKSATQFDFQNEFEKTIDPDGTINQALKPPDLPDYFDPTLPGMDVPQTAALEAPAAGVVAHGEEVPEPPVDLLVEPELPFPDGSLPHRAEPTQT
ncbi:MAG TPA: Sec-independent protein translocase protein TatB [Stellaceae bacterium]|jgi:sec-independent protein translocase protein TatB|nr:Sec-independent protein translocase protein TatB [Stellaceae bacterium]